MNWAVLSVCWYRLCQWINSDFAWKIGRRKFGCFVIIFLKRSNRYGNFCNLSRYNIIFYNHFISFYEYQNPSIVLVEYIGNSGYWSFMMKKKIFVQYRRCSSFSSWISHKHHHRLIISQFLLWIFIKNVRINK